MSRTDIPLRLTRLLDTLVLEENGETANALAAEAADPNHAGGTGMGSCMEYVLRERGECQEESRGEERLMNGTI